MVIERITAAGPFRTLVQRLRDREGAISASGLWGSFAPILVGALSRELQGTFCYITAHFDHADQVRDDLELVPGVEVDLLSAWETTPGKGAASDEIAAERMRVLLGITTPGAAKASGAGDAVPVRNREDAAVAGRIIVAPIQALMQPVPTPETLQRQTLLVGRGESIGRAFVEAWLVDHGFTRLDLVESPGDFSVRGDIVDVFAPGHTDPVRIEFLGETVESIRRFDVSTQRSFGELNDVRVAATQESTDYSKPDQFTSFFSYLPQDAVIVFDEPLEIDEIGRALWERLNQPIGMYPVDAVIRSAERFRQLHLGRFSGSAGTETIPFPVESLSRFETKSSEAIQALLDMARDNDVVVYCDNEAERKRFGEVLEESLRAEPHIGDAALLERIQTPIGLIHRGFRWAPANLVVVGHHEIFHRYEQRHRLRRTRAARPVESWLDLGVGDYVVHVGHGIGRFDGIKTMQKPGSKKREDFLLLHFAGRAVVHVPVSQIDLVQKYIGAGGIKPRLSKIGGTRWKNTKASVEEAVDSMAGDLLVLQAEREAKTGIAYPSDTAWQREFEGSFIYTETEDQLAVNEEIKRDMLRERPMDRLVCGDVGYGKTELAMRAAFKAIEFGKQVAVLVPTTVLAAQHEKTFRERMADYPFMIESLSRFRSKAEQAEIIRRARKGQVDVLIGTHRLLSKDVGFADLGLVIIDEEQRFGVEHKERLKRMRSTVDVITMTATPIPRTLHMSMMGIRDISSLATPPMDRRNIVTQVRSMSDEMIREAIIREMNRDGQVYFLHNRVKEIQQTANDVRRIVPECRVLVAHGQMPIHELAETMSRFVQHEADVLVCTTIIESGIDIPNVNTIFINRAERFGLAELHQLRGRVGRYKHRAYCYLLPSPDHPLTLEAAKRLKAIEEFSELGAGFRIAMRDLEIRGAGNILGSEQSGHIAAVGYEMYCQLLERAVRRMRNEPDPTPRPVHLELDLTAHVPRSYVRADRQRMEIYRRVVGCNTREGLDELQHDLVDAFGPIPPVVDTLLQLAEVRVLCQPWRVRSIILERPDLIFAVEDMSLSETLFKGAAGTVRVPDAETVHWRPPASYLKPETMLTVLRNQLSKNAPGPGSESAPKSEAVQLHHA